MSDIYTRLSDISLSEIKSSLSSNKRWSEQSSAEIKAHIDKAVRDVCSYRNSLGKSTYKVDSIADADLVLAPTASGLSALYEDYIQIKFSGGVGTAVTATAVNFTLESASYSSASGLAVYTVTLAGATVDNDTMINPGVAGQASIEFTGSNVFTVTSSIGHDDFSVFVQNMKES